MGSVAIAARELVPLRAEIVQRRQEAVEVSRAVVDMKHAKEEDQASFLIARKAAARLIRKKHLKALARPRTWCTPTPCTSHAVHC